MRIIVYSLHPLHSIIAKDRLRNKKLIYIHTIIVQENDSE